MAAPRVMLPRSGEEQDCQSPRILPRTISVTPVIHQTRRPTDATWHRVGSVTIRNHMAKLQPTRRLPPAFSHTQHSGRQRLSCADCHNYSAGLPQKRQVSSPRPLEHFPPETTLAPLVITASEPSAEIWILKIAADVIRAKASEWRALARP